MSRRLNKVKSKLDRLDKPIFIGFILIWIYLVIATILWPPIKPPVPEKVYTGPVEHYLGTAEIASITSCTILSIEHGIFNTYIKLTDGRTLVIRSHKPHSLFMVDSVAEISSENN